MRLPRAYRLDLLSATEKDSAAPSMRHVGVERVVYPDRYADRLTLLFGYRPNGIAVVCNGFAMAVVPCAIDEQDDVPPEGAHVAFDPREVLPLARRFSGQDASLTISLAPNMVCFDLYTTVRRYSAGDTPSAYLSWRKAAAPATGTPVTLAASREQGAPMTGERYRFAMDVGLLRKVVGALGCADMTFSMRSSYRPTLLYPVAYPSTSGYAAYDRSPADSLEVNLPLPPFGIIMPKLVNGQRYRDDL